MIENNRLHRKLGCFFIMLYLTKAQKQFIRRHEKDDVRELALRKSVSGRRDASFLLAQIKGRQIAQHKIPSWYAYDEIIYPVHLSLEQASSEATARYKASLFKEKYMNFVDLTGGLGVDFAFLSRRFQQVVYVEQNEKLCEIAAHNFDVLGLKNGAIKNVTAETYLQQMPNVNMIYLDPSRRDNVGRKVFRIEDCSPNIAEINSRLLQKAETILIKYSPMLDISLAVKTLENVSTVHIVSVENECKELLFMLQQDAKNRIVAAVNFLKDGTIEAFTFNPQEEQCNEIQFVSTIENYLYEPNASILKAGAFKTIAKRFDLKKLHQNSHLYTSDKLIADFQGRIFDVRDTFVPNKHNLQSFLHETKKAHIAVRNFPMSVAEIRKKAGISDGGDVYIFATTLSDEKKVWIVCKKVK